MAPSHRATPPSDVWRPEASRARRAEKAAVVGRPSVARGRSPVSSSARTAQGHDRPFKTSQPTTDEQHSSNKHSRAHSHKRSRSRTRRRSRARSASRSASPGGSGVYRPARGEGPSAERTTSHSHRHHHHSPPSSKRRRSVSPFTIGDHKTKRRRSRSFERSSFRSRPYEEPSRRHLQRPNSPPPPYSDRQRSRRSPPTHYTASSRRRRSPSVESYYRDPAPKQRRRSPTPERRPSRRGPQHLQDFISKPSQRHKAPERAARAESDRERLLSGESHRRGKEKAARELFSSKSRRAPSPLHSHRRRSRSPPNQRHSPERAREDREERQGRDRSPRESPRRKPSRSPPAFKIKGKASSQQNPTTSDKPKERQHSPRGESGYDSDTRDSTNGDSMNPYPMRGRPTRPPIDTRQFSGSPPWNYNNQGSPQGHSPYGNTRGGWGGQQQYGSHHG